MRDKDKEVIKKTGVKTLRDEKWQIKEGLVLKERRVYVPKDKKLRVEIIWLYHNMTITRYGEQ